MSPLVVALLFTVAPLHADTGDTADTADTADTDRPSTHDTAATAEVVYTQASGCGGGASSAALLVPAALLGLSARRRSTR